MQHNPIICQCIFFKTIVYFPIVVNKSANFEHMFCVMMAEYKEGHFHGYPQFGVFKSFI